MKILLLLLYLHVQMYICIKLEITRTTNQDLYKGLGQCIHASHDTGEGECKCNFDEKTFYGNEERVSLGCHKNQKIIEDTGCTDFRIIDNSVSTSSTPCIYQSIGSVEIWNYVESQEVGKWENFTESMIFKITNQTLDVIPGLSELSSLLFKIKVNCKQKENDHCELIAFTGTSLYPRIPKTRTIPSITSTLSTTPVGSISTTTKTTVTFDGQSQQPYNQTTIEAQSNQPETWLLIHFTVFGVALILGILAIIWVYKSKLGRRLRSNKIRNKQNSYTRPIQPNQQPNPEENDNNDTCRELEDDESEYHNYDAHYKSLTFSHNREPNTYHELNRALTMPSQRDTKAPLGYTTTTFHTDITQPTMYSAPNLNTIDSNGYHLPEGHEIKQNTYYNIQDVHQNTYQLPDIIETEPQQEDYRVIEPEYKEIIEVPYETIPVTQNYMVIDD